MQKFGLKVAKNYANAAKNALRGEGLLATEYAVLRDQNSVIFPLTKKPAKTQLHNLPKGAKIVKKNFRLHAKKPNNLKEALEGKLTKAEMKNLVSSYDLLGDVAVIEIAKGLGKKEKTIANAVMEVNPMVKTVCKIASAHTGKYRVQKIKVVAGKKKKIATYKEHGCIFKISLEKVFFSPRLSNERKRIAAQIKEGENVAVFFAGVGPFAIVAAKHAKPAKVYAIEMNPAAYKDMLENIGKNKVGEKVEAILGDVKSVVPKKCLGIFDRVVMPLPKGGEDFLDVALKALKPEGGTIHFYQFGPIESPFKPAVEAMQKAADEAGKNFKVVYQKIVRPYSAKIVQVVIDFAVE